MRMMDGGLGVLDCAREEVQGVDDTAPLGHCGLGEVVVEDLDSVRIVKCFGHSVHHVEAAVVVGDGADVEAFAAAKVSRLAATWIGVDDDESA